MADRKRVALEVDPETKDRWKTAVKESNEYSSLSGLIRKSVTAELSDDTATSTQQAQLESDSEVVKELTNTLSRIERKVEDIDNRVSSLEGNTADSKASVIKNKIFTSLNRTDEAKTPQRIANETGFDEEQVSEQLEKLESSTGLLDSFEGPDGKTRYLTENN